VFFRTENVVGILYLNRELSMQELLNVQVGFGEMRGLMLIIVLLDDVNDSFFQLQQLLI